MVDEVFPPFAVFMNDVFNGEILLLYFMTVRTEDCSPFLSFSVAGNTETPYSRPSEWGDVMRRISVANIATAHQFFFIEFSNCSFQGILELQTGASL